MPLITILTPAHVSAKRWLPETAQSVLGQDLSDNWELEWIIEADGSDGKSLSEVLPADDRISFSAHDGDLGPAVTRNIGLARARGVYVQTLDADDLLLPGALSTMISALQEHPSVHWAYAQADDLMPDGTRVSFEPWMPPCGLIPAQRLPDWIDEHGGNVPAPCAALCYRTTTIRAMGGWMALPAGEDIGLLAAISTVTAGWQSEATTWLYRQHPGQMIRRDTQPHWSTLARQVTLQRISALRLTKTALTGTADERNHTPDVAPAMKYAVDLP
jgi:glycosyltransferase involved in cell wall biosynthesis